jgi:hypothetical protein
VSAGGPPLASLRLVAGGSAAAREAAIAAALAPGRRAAAILEGLPDGRSILLDALERAAALAPGAAPDAGCAAPAAALPDILHLAPACLCCAGNLVLRVSLNRVLRRRPEQLFIGLADPAHLEQLRLWLSSAPYDSLLHIGADLAPLDQA